MTKIKKIKLKSLVKTSHRATSRFIKTIRKETKALESKIEAAIEEEKKLREQRHKKGKTLFMSCSVNQILEWASLPNVWFPSNKDIATLVTFSKVKKTSLLLLGLEKVVAKHLSSHKRSFHNDMWEAFNTPGMSGLLSKKIYSKIKSTTLDKLIVKRKRLHEKLFAKKRLKKELSLLDGFGIGDSDKDSYIKLVKGYTVTGTHIIPPSECAFAKEDLIFKIKKDKKLWATSNMFMVQLRNKKHKFLLAHVPGSYTQLLDTQLNYKKDVRYKAKNLFVIRAYVKKKKKKIKHKVYLLIVHSKELDIDMPLVFDYNLFNFICNEQDWDKLKLTREAVTGSKVLLFYKGKELVGSLKPTVLKG